MKTRFVEIASVIVFLEMQYGNKIFQDTFSRMTSFYWFGSLFHKNYETSFLEILIPFLKETFETAMETPIVCAEKENGGLT